MPCNTSDADVQAGLQALAAEGGGVLLFPRGTYYLAEPLLVPPGVLLQGEARELSSVYFAEDTQESAPPALLALDLPVNSTQPGSWGVRGLTVYVSGFFNAVIQLTNSTSGFELADSRILANAFFASNGPGTNTRGRWTNWTLEAPGPVLDARGSNWQVVDSEIYASSGAINSMAKHCPDKSWPSYCHGTTFGYVARNRLWNGLASHFMNQMMQVVFEDNEVTGVSPIAMGNSVGTGPYGGYAQHILSQRNSVRFVWGNDRELLTFDDAGGAYFGLLAQAQGTRIVTAHDTVAAASMEWGGWAGGTIVVMNGTGAGQYRRIVAPGSGPGLRVWEMDAPFAVGPGADSIVEIMPFRGENIWHADYFADGGALQIYGHGVENVFCGVQLERTTGMLAWGQWRGWDPPSEGAHGEGAHAARQLRARWSGVQEHGGTGAEAASPGLRGVMGNGIQPNLRTSYLSNAVLEGNCITNYNSTLSYDTFYGGVRFNAMGAESGGHPLPVPHNLGLVYRGNVVLSNGGFSVGESCADVLMEGNVAMRSGGNVSELFVADGRVHRVLLRNNSAP